MHGSWAIHKHLAFQTLSPKIFWEDKAFWNLMSLQRVSIFMWDAKAKECQSKWTWKQKEVKRKLILKIKWLSNQADVTASGCHRKWMSKTGACQRQVGATVNSCSPFVLPRAKYWHMIAQHLQSAKGLEEAKENIKRPGSEVRTLTCLDHVAWTLKVWAL